jgi:diguanylate cyclase (GGDEF)-like protein
VLTRTDGGWDRFLQDATVPGKQSLDILEAVANQVLRADAPADHGEGVAIGDEVCFPLAAGGTIVGVLGIGSDPTLSSRTRRAVSAASATIAIAVRNVQLMHDIRAHGERDALTGCLNRANGVRTLQAELRRARRTGRNVSVVMVDIDHFKAVNDTGGHLRGDAGLAAVGAQLTEVLRSTDLRCRFGGDEFLLVLPDTPVLGAQQVAETLRRSVADLLLPTGEPAAITLSLGVAAAIPGELDPAEVIARADQALYRAKRAGRDRFCLAPARGTSLQATAAAPAAAAG